MSFRGPHVPPPVHWSYRHVLSLPTFFLGSVDLNSDYTADSLGLSPSTQLSTNLFSMMLCSCSLLFGACSTRGRTEPAKPRLRKGNLQHSHRALLRLYKQQKPAGEGGLYGTAAYNHPRDSSNAAFVRHHPFWGGLLTVQLP